MKRLIKHQKKMKNTMYIVFGVFVIVGSICYFMNGNFGNLSNVGVDSNEIYNAVSETGDFKNLDSENSLDVTINPLEPYGEIERSQNELDGEYVLYYNDGQVAMKINYENGLLDGEQFFYDGSGQLSMKKTYKNGRLDGEQLFYFEFGNNVAIKMNYKDGKLNGEQFNSVYCDVLRYSDSMICDKVNNYKDGKLDGEQIAYYENGKIANKHFSKDGKFDGERVVYYDDGQIKENGTYRDGKLDGEQFAYYKDGKLEWKKYYEDGRIKGNQIYYYENGEISSYSYMDGIRTTLIFDSEGKLVRAYDNVGNENDLPKFEMNIIDDGSDWIYHEYYGGNLDMGIGKFRNGKMECVSYDDSYEIIYGNTLGILDTFCNVFGENDEFKALYVPSLLPNSAEITVADEINLGEATDFGITILKNGSKMSSYLGTIGMFVTEEDGTPLKENEFSSDMIYTFLLFDSGFKEFKKGLTINKEGKFYIELIDFGNVEDEVLLRQLVTVVKK